MNTLKIRPPQSLEEYQWACALVEKEYRQAGYVPEQGSIKHPHALLLALRDGLIIGSVGVRSADSGQLPTEEAYGFRAETLGLLDRSQVFESLRLAVSDRSDIAAMKGLIVASIAHAERWVEGSVWLMTVKPIVGRALLRYCHLVTEVLPLTPRPEVFQQYPGYWGSSPQPTAVMVSNANANAALARLTIELEGKVDIDVSDFNHHLDYGDPATYQHALAAVV